MAICQWQSFKAAECWICQISDGHPVMSGYLMLLMLAVISLYLSCASSLPCTQSSAVPGVSVSRRLSPCDSDVFRAVACGHRMPSAASAPSASRSKYKASDFAFSSVDTWPPARRLRKTSPCLSKVIKNITKPFLPRPLGSLMKSSHVSHCFPKHLDNHSRTPSRRIRFDSFTWFKHSRYHLII